jgi:NAD-dependent protein deacetylase/lipoamidase
MLTLVDLLRKAQRTLVFTGAGISTGSGIPDFRGPDGVWKKRQPVYHDEFLASEEKRIEYWTYKLEGYERFRDARPNATHLAIAELERLGRVQAVVTQNIDGLHQAAGSSEAKVVEVHGTNRFVECLACEERYAPAPLMAWFAEHRTAPVCACGGWLKSATISFGQALRPEVVRRAMAEAAEADLVLALGSTLLVQPAAGIPLVAVRAGAPYVIVNRGATDHDAIATLRIEGDVSDVLPLAVAAL